MRSLLLCLASISFIVPIESYLNQIQPQKAQLQFGQTSPSSFFKLHLSTPTASQLYPEADCLETGDCPLDFYENSDVDVNIKKDNMLHNIQSDDLQLILRGCGPQATLPENAREQSHPQFHDGSTFTPTGLSILTRIWSEHRTDQDTFTASSVSQWASKCAGYNLSVYSNEVLKIYNSLNPSNASPSGFAFPAFMGFYASAAQRRLDDVNSDFVKYLVPEDKPRPPKSSNLWDECEITELNIFNEVDEDDISVDVPSHKTVSLCSDSKTPKLKQNYVFVDEGSCIGCTLCAQSSPSTFKPTSTGMFRAYTQKTSNIEEALSSCPVSCIHTVSFPELIELETRRMSSNEKETPVWVRGIESSSANHDTTVYHSVKHSCYMSSQCPTRGCYDCPHYDTKGGNPQYKKMEREGDDIRKGEWRKKYEKDIRITADI
ncbi:hypothetical protein TrST_g6717 [Triparma strigata]|uniref:4Fe-4S ferredoxin-type domain-containing protein n=1 Tax=Triparma strigata TaxID=1606541 RepID=A0A9W6ZZV8_9STRA|nr:hypothetical protein TrST_g6717 [Triparma strigata]